MPVKSKPITLPVDSKPPREREYFLHALHASLTLIYILFFLGILKSLIYVNNKFIAHWVFVNYLQCLMIIEGGGGGNTTSRTKISLFISPSQLHSSPLSPFLRSAYIAHLPISLSLLFLPSLSYLYLSFSTLSFLDPLHFSTLSLSLPCLFPYPTSFSTLYLPFFLLFLSLSFSLYPLPY